MTWARGRDDIERPLRDGELEPRTTAQVAATIDISVTVKETGRVAEALEIHLWTFGDDGKVVRFFHAVDRHAFVNAYAR